MRKTRRIEITAFRWTRTLLAGEPNAGLTESLPEGQNSGLNSTEPCSGRANQTDVVEAILSTADNASWPDLMCSKETPVLSTGDGPLAAQQARLGRNRLYLRLRTLGFSIKKLITGWGSRRR